MVRARVRKGRLVVDEPTDLPEGTEVDLIADDPLGAVLAAAPPADVPLSADEAAELRSAAAGTFTPHEDLRAKLAPRSRG